MSFSYNLNATKCRLYSTGHYVPNNGTNATGWKFYEFGGHQCPIDNGFEHARSFNICYHLSLTEMDGSNSRQNCLARNSKLISLDTTAKLTNFHILLNTVLTSVTGLYVGLSKDENQNWIWDNGNFLTDDTQWGSGEPNCPGCRYATKAKSNNWKMGDGTGSGLKRSVCEVEIA
ncbi:hypothetical protein ACF0H5_008572 [Mactra antiquata]